jgi:microcystin degradation protein MlrC
VLADFADNPAGGAYGDSPNLLRAMLDAGLDNAAFATLADAAAVARARDAGEGADLTLAWRAHDPPAPAAEVTAPAS